MAFSKEYNFHTSC